MNEKLFNLILFLVLVLTVTGLHQPQVYAETEILRATGLIQPVIQKEISAEISGKIEEVNYQVGDQINDDPLFSIYSQTASKELALAKENLEDAKLRLDQERERLAQARIG